MNNEEPLDFSWATYKDPDKVEKYLETYEPKNNVINKKPLNNVKSSVSKKVVKTAKFSISDKQRKTITWISIFVASTMAFNIVSAKAKKISASNDNDTISSIGSGLMIDDSSVKINDIKDEETFTINPEIDNNDTKVIEHVTPEDEIKDNSFIENKPTQINNINQNIIETNKSYKDVCINVSEKAANYLTDDVYNTIINNYKDSIKKYSEMYGVDPNIVAGLIMVESPDYDINNDHDFHKIGLGQYKGEYFDNDTFTTYNFKKGEMESYTVHADNLYANPDEQIKMICITLATSTKLYDYNLVATLEHHNKGCGSVKDALEDIMIEKGYDNIKEVQNYEDQNEIISHIQKIGDPRYSQKIVYCACKCLENKVFGEKDNIVFKDYENNMEHITNLSYNTMQRS